MLYHEILLLLGLSTDIIFASIKDDLSSDILQISILLWLSLSISLHVDQSDDLPLDHIVVNIKIDDFVVHVIIVQALLLVDSLGLPFLG